MLRFRHRPDANNLAGSELIPWIRVRPLVGIRLLVLTEKKSEELRK